MRQAVILAGGKGTRLAERLHGRPKPLVMVDGIPLLERQIHALARWGVEEIVLLVNHAADQIEAFVAERSLPCRVRLVDDGDPAGTAGAVLAQLDRLEDRFLVVYGDTLFDVDIDHLVQSHEAAGADATLLIHPNDHPQDSDLVEVDDAGWIIAFHSYPHPSQSIIANLVNAALYCVDKSALARWSAQVAAPCDFAKDLFPAMLAKGARLLGLHTFEYIKDIGTPDRLDRAERQLRAGKVARASRSARQRAVFIDRDGTLNVQRGYIRCAAELELIGGAGAAVRALNAAEYRVVIVTNQPVLARGEADIEDLRRIHAKLSFELGLEGAMVDAIYFCPHHPDSGFAGEIPDLKIVCDCRKPAVGLFTRAISEMNIDPDQSWMIGDSTADIQAGHAIGARTILVRTGEGGLDGKNNALPNFTVDDIGAAARLIVETGDRRIPLAALEASR